MTRTLRTSLPALLLAACSSGTDITALFPANNEVGSWGEDTNVGVAGVEVADSAAAARALVGDDADPFISHGMKAFGWEHYAKDDYGLELRIWQMDSAEDASSVYDFTVTSVQAYAGQTWTSVDSLGDEARIAKISTDDVYYFWWLNVRVGEYAIESKINTSTDENVSRQEQQDFIAAVVAKAR